MTTSTSEPTVGSYATFHVRYDKKIDLNTVYFLKKMFQIRCTSDLPYVDWLVLSKDIVVAAGREENPDGATR